MSKQGVLLINLGSPVKAEAKAVQRYLKEFLSDPRVIDLPLVMRWILVNIVINPFRHKKTTQAYQKIWGEDGSPLMHYSLKCAEELRQELGSQYQVELAMRYGKPSIEKALERLKGCHRITVLPLFPQYSSAATGSALEKLFVHLSKQWNIPELHIIKDFHDDPGFIHAFSEIIKTTIGNKPLDQLIFSYHGLPERQVKKSHCQSACQGSPTCVLEDSAPSYCYRAQCYRSSALLALSLDLNPEDYSVAFQSRLGRTPWIKPYTDLLLPQLRQRGMKNIAIVCPSFVADCLETLEEINIRAREQWQKLGGEGFTFIPCLNAHPYWIKALSQMVKVKKS